MHVYKLLLFNNFAYRLLYRNMCRWGGVCYCARKPELMV